MIHRWTIERDRVEPDKLGNRRTIKRIVRWSRGRLAIGIVERGVMIVAKMVKIAFERCLYDAVSGNH